LVGGGMILPPNLRHRAGGYDRHTAVRAMFGFGGAGRRWRAR